MKITSKGQVTVPIGIRQRFGLLPDTEVAFEARGGAVVIRKVRESGRRGANVVARLKGKATAGLSTDEILAFTRGRHARRQQRSPRCPDRGRPLVRVVLRSLGAPSRGVGARHQSDHLRGGVYRLRADRGAGPGAEGRRFREAAAAVGSRVPRGQVLPALPAPRRRSKVHASGLLHRRQRRGFGPRSPHAGRGAISDVLPAAGGHFTVGAVGPTP